MDNSYFYNNYGQIIAEKQKANNRIGQWPYIIPDSTQNIPIDDDNIRNKFRSNSIAYSFGGPVGVILKECEVIPNNRYEIPEVTKKSVREEEGVKSTIKGWEVIDGGNVEVTM